MKNLRYILLPLATIFTILFTCCSDDEPTPSKNNSLITCFRETYGFQAEKIGPESYETKNLMIPVRGVKYYKDGVYDLTISASLHPQLPLPEGMQFSADRNPAWYDLHIKRYGDDNYSGKPLKDIYEPHPYGIVKIDMTVVYDVNDMYIIKPPYNKTSDYNGHYKGLNQDSPWYEMDLDEFNARGGAKLIDMTKFYLIAKEAPIHPPYQFDSYRVFKTDIYFDNGKKNRTTKEMKIFSRF